MDEGWPFSLTNVSELGKTKHKALFSLFFSVTATFVCGGGGNCLGQYNVVFTFFLSFLKNVFAPTNVLQVKLELRFETNA
jgi:hypothetical protein